MNLRKTLILGAAAAAAGVFALTPSTQASSPTGSDITTIEVGGDASAGTVPVQGVYKSGTATFDLLNFTTGCTSGTVAGTLNRGPFTSGSTAFNFTTLTLSCPTPLGISANIALNAGCVAGVTMGNVKQAPLNDNVHDSFPSGTVDSGMWVAGGSKPKVHNVLGRATIPSKCVTVTLTSGSCTARADGNFQVQFDEAVKTVAGVDYQDLVLNGSGLTLRNQTPACFGLMQGGVTLNAIRFNLRPTPPATGPIDFR